MSLSPKPLTLASHSPTPMMQVPLLDAVKQISDLREVKDPWLLLSGCTGV